MIAGVYGDPGEVDQWTRYSVRAGQNLGDIFAELGIPPGMLEKTLNATKTSRTLAALRPGEQFAFLMREPGKLAGLQFDADDTVRVVLRYRRRRRRLPAEGRASARNVESGSRPASSTTRCSRGRRGGGCRAA
jgi:hypothetical protein